jgi:hypothetical protein
MNRFLISKGRTAAVAAAGALGGSATPNKLPSPSSLRGSASTVSVRTIRHFVSVSVLDNDSVVLGSKPVTRSFLLPNMMLQPITTGTVRRGLAKHSASGNRYAPDQNRNHTKSGGVPPPKQQQAVAKKNDGMLRLQMCWTPYDLEAMEPDGDDGDLDEDGDEYMFVKAKFDLKDIKQKTKEMFESSKDLEYHDGEEWKPLTNIQDLSKYKGSTEPVPIRVPEVYDEDGYNYEDDEDEDDNESYNYKDDDDDNDDYRYAPKSHEARQMKSAIFALVARLQAQGYTRCPDQTPLTLFHAATNTKLSTVTWILSQAIENSANSVATIEEDDGTLDPETLEDLILGHVGALQHMAQCLDYDLVWQPRTVDKDDPDTIDATTV